MQEKVQKMMDLLKSAKFNVITIDGKILLTIKLDDKEHSFTLNWDGEQDYWCTIEIGKYYFDVNVWIECGTRHTSAYPVIDGETIMSSFYPIHSEPLKKEKEQLPNGLPIGKTKLQGAIEILEKHNAWRKGGGGEATDPKQLTWALDLTLSYFNEKTQIVRKPQSDLQEKKQKYYFVVIHELNNDKEYSINQVYAIDDKENVDEWLAKNVLVPWYGNGEDGEMQSSGACEHLGCEIIVSIERYQEIPKEDFDVLSRYI